MKNNKYFLVILLIVLLLTGCSSESKEDNTYNTSNLSHIKCSRDASVDDSDTKVEINYDIYYDKDNYLSILKSVEKITSSNEEVLDEYEKAYKNIYSAYDNLEYYDNEVERDTNTVISKTSINYAKIDMDKLMDIEGSDNNVTVTDGKIKLDDWKSFAKKYGTVCK